MVNADKMIREGGNDNTVEGKGNVSKRITGSWLTLDVLSTIIRINHEVC